jgi:hypothetical protein
MKQEEKQQYAENSLPIPRDSKINPSSTKNIPPQSKNKHPREIVHHFLPPRDKY